MCSCGRVRRSEIKGGGEPNMRDELKRETDEKGNGGRSKMQGDSELERARQGARE